MKRTSMALVLLTGLFMAGCEQPPPPPSQAEQILKGEHKLRKMVERTETNSNISGGFFLFVGALSGGTTTSMLVKFAWEMNDGTYALSSLPLEKIRIKLDEDITTPTIKFRWGPSNHPQTLQRLIDSNVLYAVITAKESDWPIQVNLPLN